jgi:hypothetical protein
MNGDAEILIAEWKSKRNRWLYGAENGREKGASEVPRAPTKIEVVRQFNPMSRKRCRKKRSRHAKRNKCLAATVTKRKGK